MKVVTSTTAVLAASTLLADKHKNAADATTYTAQLVKDIVPGGTEDYPGLDFLGYGADPKSFVVALDRLFFTASTVSHGRELWSMDKEENIAMVKDINNTTEISSGSAWPGSTFDSLGFGYHTTAVLGDRLFFYANDGNAGTELWSTDGTEIGTYMVKDVLLGSTVDETVLGYGAIGIAAFGGLIHFTVQQGQQNLIYVTDGTAEGTEKLEMGVNSALPPTTMLSYITELNGMTYFPAEGQVCRQLAYEFCSEGRSLFVTEGTAESTHQPFTLESELVSTPSNFKEIVVHNGKLYFETEEGLYSSDGTDNGTTLLLANSQGYGFESMGEHLYFLNKDNYYDWSLWKTDGTAEGTSVVTGIGIPANTRGLTALKDKLLFIQAESTSVYAKPWVSDGTEEGTMMLVDLDASDSSTAYIVYDGHAFFKGEDAEHGSELWVTDGTPANTVIVKDINPGLYGSDIQSFAVLQDTLYFAATDYNTGSELWKVVKCDLECPTFSTDTYTQSSEVPMMITPATTTIASVQTPSSADAKTPSSNGTPIAPVSPEGESKSPQTSPSSSNVEISNANGTPSAQAPSEGETTLQNKPAQNSPETSPIALNAGVRVNQCGNTSIIFLIVTFFIFW